jgi:hypothetical protein
MGDPRNEGAPNGERGEGIPASRERFAHSSLLKCTTHVSVGGAIRFTRPAERERTDRAVGEELTRGMPGNCCPPEIMTLLWRRWSLSGSALRTWEVLVLHIEQLA